MGRGAAAALPPWHALPDEVWEHAFSFLPAYSDRGAAAAACRSWLRAERRSRRRLAVANCYAASPQDAVDRFPSVRAVEVKGKPHFADFGLRARAARLGRCRRAVGRRRDPLKQERERGRYREERER